MAESTARISPYRNGPYLVRGEFEIVDQDGEPIATTRRTVALCRCGHSAIRPFCDGTHKLVRFQAGGDAETDIVLPYASGASNDERSSAHASSS